MGVLYSGAIAIPPIFGWTREQVPLWWVTTTIGVIGSIYAISGGLKAVAVSDCFNGIGLLIVGLWVPLAAISRLPNGLSDLFDNPENLQVWTTSCPVLDTDLKIRGMDVPAIPWHVVPFGLTVNNLYYWATNQIIVQRALGAESLAQGQKGVLFAACMKVMGFAFLCMPGILALTLERMGVQDNNGVPFAVRDKADTVYPELVNFVMPAWSKGVFVAVLMGSVLSTFNSGLNSASTMFSLELYKVYIDPEASQESLVRVGGLVGTLLTAGSFFIAPQFETNEGIFNSLQLINTFVSLPIVSVFLVGIFTSLPDALAAKTGFLVGAVTIISMQAFNGAENNPFYDNNAPAWANLHFLRIFELSFLFAMEIIAIMTYSPMLRQLLGGKGTPTPPTPFVQKNNPAVDTTPFASLHLIILGNAVALTVLLFVLQQASLIGFYLFWLLWIMVCASLILAPVPETVPVDRKAGAGSFLLSLRTNTFSRSSILSAQI